MGRAPRRAALIAILNTHKCSKDLWDDWLPLRAVAHETKIPERAQSPAMALAGSL
jgi:hypothetical protein